MNDSYGWQQAREARGYLALEDGSVFRGWSVGAAAERCGEVVFNTGMTGYQEILSDPSYAGQLVCLTAPEIGNTGVNPFDMESRRYFAAGLLAHEVRPPSSWRSRETLSDSLCREDVPALAGIDTRALTTVLRDKGAQKGFISATGETPVEEGIARAKGWEGLTGQDYVSRVTTEKAYKWDADNSLTFTYPHDRGILPPADYWVVAYDFGIKWNILRCLRRSGIEVTVVPARTPAEAVLDMKPDGVFLSNGPADPAAVRYAADAIARLLGKVPLMGICLGHQLLGMALGGTTYKLRFGHHGCNHPVKDLRHDRTLITSQNHNYALVPESIADSVAEITHISLNDDSVEGLSVKNAPAFSVQYHPEAAPGPHDAENHFARFYAMMRDWG
ncbi:MAG: glutamine-hydrolyzing carbamoyl-phosphate synthase small subunit [Planctomycetes bacterium]|nr:glutamine-hydrolyzing carbamoyl-phosphate synthase small subunit [Planctomycetota bacterium]